MIHNISPGQNILPGEFSVFNNYLKTLFLMVVERLKSFTNQPSKILYNYNTYKYAHSSENIIDIIYNSNT